MKTVKAIDTRNYSIWLVEYPNHNYCVGYSTLTDTKTTILLTDLRDALEIFESFLDYVQGGGGLQ